MRAILDIQQLHLSLKVGRQFVPILRGIDLRILPGQVHGLVGESGAGKSMVAKAVLGILPPGAIITAGRILFAGQDITHLSNRQRRHLYGNGLALIPQDPITALNPVRRIESQMIEMTRLHLSLDASAARQYALEMLHQVQIRMPERVLRLYPHELSGGMRQRVLIAIAFSCRPRLIVADEPTTALDVTVQRQILRLIKELQTVARTSLMFVTHDLGVVSKICDQVTVIHSGRVLESQAVEPFFSQPQHRYTQALFEAIPRYDRPGDQLHPVPSELTQELLAQNQTYDQQAGAYA